MSEPSPRAGTDPEPAAHTKRPVVWMVVAGVALLAAIGLGLWAVKVNSDLDATQSELEAQKSATESAQAQVSAQAEAASAAAAELEQIDADNEIYVVSNEEVAQAQTYLDRERQNAAREVAQGLNVTEKGDLKL